VKESFGIGPKSLKKCGVTYKILMAEKPAVFGSTRAEASILFRAQREAAPELGSKGQGRAGADGRALARDARVAARQRRIDIDESLVVEYHA